MTKRGRALAAAAMVAAVVKGEQWGQWPRGTEWTAMRPATQSGYTRQYGRQGIEMDVTMIHTNIGMWENLHKAIGLFKFESHVSEDLTLGTTVSTSGVTKTAFALFDFGRGCTEATINFEDTEKIKGESRVSGRCTEHWTHAAAASRRPPPPPAASHHLPPSANRLPNPNHPPQPP